MIVIYYEIWKKLNTPMPLQLNSFLSKFE